MDSETNDIIARALYMGVAEPRDPADWASLELERGRDGKNLRILASEFNAKSLLDVKDRLHAAIEELGWSVPDEETAIWQHAESIMRKIVEGSLSPQVGCSKLYHLCCYMEYPHLLIDWYGLYWGSEEFGEEKLHELIIDEARRRLNGEETELMNEPFMLYAQPVRSPNLWERICSVFKNL